MIQRIQTIYLGITALLSLMLLKISVLSFADQAGKTVRLFPSGIFKDQEGSVLMQMENTWPLIAAVILISLIALMTIFLFRNRRVQMSVALVVIILSIVLVAILSGYSYFIMRTYSMTIIPDLKMALPVLIVISSLLAYRGIKKDEQLVKSYDRLR